MSDLAPEADGSVHDAAAQINALFAPAEPAAPTRQRDEKGRFVNPDAPIPLTPADGSPDPDLPEPEPVAEEPAPEEAEEEGKAEAAPEDDGEQEEEAPAKNVPKVKLKIGGKVQEVVASDVLVPVKADGMVNEVPLSEALAGYSRTKDYTIKTQAHAEEKKRFDAEVVQPLTEERRYYAERIGMIEEALQEFQSERAPDWNTLRQQLSPEDFQQRWVEWDTRQKHIAGIRAEKERVAAREADADARRHKAIIDAELQKLQDALPDLKDPEKGKALTADLIAYAESLGYPEYALGAVEDHQLIVMLNKARLWDQSQLRKPKLEEKVDRVLESVKPSNAKPKPKMSEIERASTRLKETGRVEDAAWLINQRLRSK